MEEGSGICERGKNFVRAMEIWLGYLNKFEKSSSLKCSICHRPYYEAQFLKPGLPDRHHSNRE